MDHVVDVVGKIEVKKSRVRSEGCLSLKVASRSVHQLSAQIAIAPSYCAPGLLLDLQ